MRYPHHGSTAPTAVFERYLDDARRILSEAIPTRDSAEVSADFDQLRWFDLPATSFGR
jgi:hypothetical protein